MSNHIIELPPQSPIEAPSLVGDMRNSKEPLTNAAGKYCGRYHQRFLPKMHGAFLTLLDKDGKILLFVAGALRRQVSKTVDEVSSFCEADILRGVTGGYQPEVTTIELSGENKWRDHPAIFREIPYLSLFLGGMIPEAVSWGILQVGPHATLKYKNGVPNGTNSEIHLDPRHWKQKEGADTFGGGQDLTARLAPEAVDYAKVVQSAWPLAVTATYLFGGMQTNMPDVDVCRKSKALNDIIDSEVSIRRQRKRERALARMEQNQGGRRDENLRQLQNALDPMVVDAIEEKVNQAVEGESPRPAAE